MMMMMMMMMMMCCISCVVSCEHTSIDPQAVAVARFRLAYMFLSLASRLAVAYILCS